MSEENEAHSVDFSKWIGKGWWTSQEAFCVFMGHPPQYANDEAILNQLKNTDEGRYLIELIGAAEVDRSWLGSDVESLHVKLIDTTDGKRAWE